MKKYAVYAAPKDVYFTVVEASNPVEARNVVLTDFDSKIWVLNEDSEPTKDVLTDAVEASDELADFFELYAQDEDEGPDEDSDEEDEEIDEDEPDVPAVAEEKAARLAKAATLVATKPELAARTLHAISELLYPSGDHMDDCWSPDTLDAVAFALGQAGLIPEGVDEAAKHTEE